MLAYRYSPFPKLLHDLTGDDLAVLRDVSEGWFVDYKSEPLSVRDFAKHISAFGNQFGGWLFVGIAETPNKGMKAGSFPGVPTSDVSKVMVQIREAVSAHVSPPVYFDHKVIDGPVTEIGLPSGRSIIVLGVPEGPSPPYVHSTGKIYRRIADSSEPKAETDRAVLDSMWHKSDDLRKALEDFILKPTACNTDRQNQVCYVYLFSDLTFSNGDYDLSYSDFREALMTERDGAGPTLPFDSLFPTPDGFIARQVGTNDPLMELVALRWWRNGNVRLAIPISTLQPAFYEPPEDDRLAELLKAMGDARKHFHWILDLDQWLLLTVTLTSRFIALREKLQMTGPIFGKMLFTCMRGSTPFVGMPTYLETVNAFGIPVMQDDTVLCPSGTTAKSFRTLSDSPDSAPSIRPMVLILPLAIAALRAMGVPIDTSESAVDVTIKELAEAISRAILKAQQGNSRIVRQP
jgi:hypothetical protein